MTSPFAGGFENSVRRLNALRFFKLAKIIPCRQRNDLLRIDDDDAINVFVVAQENGALALRQRKIADDFDGGALAQVPFRTPALSRKAVELVLEDLSRLDAHSVCVRAAPINDLRCAKLVVASLRNKQRRG